MISELEKSCLKSTKNCHDGGGLVAQLCLTLVTPWTVARQAPLSVGFSRQEYWSGLPFHSPGDLPDPGIKPASHKSSALAGGFFSISATWEALKQGHPLSKPQYSFPKPEININTILLFNQRVLSRLSHVQLSVTPWTVARQAPLSRGFSRQECWSG